MEKSSLKTSSERLSPPLSPSQRNLYDLRARIDPEIASSVISSIPLTGQTLANMTQIFGDFNEGLPISQEFLIIGFSPSSIPLKQRWRNNGLSADFMADYLMTFVLGDDSTVSKYQQSEIKSAISYIANELLENAMKFNDEKVQHPISIRLQLYGNSLLFMTTNTIPPHRVPEFQHFLQELIASDPTEMYIRQIEKNAEDEDSTASGLGFLTMMSDYLAKLGWKFETVQKDPEAIAVTTMVQLPVKLNFIC